MASLRNYWADLIPSNRLPDFLFVGPERTASSWLHSVLEGHVCLPMGVKETRFFDRHWEKGLNWYLWHYRLARPGTLIGEIAPTYFHSRTARERIAQTAPKCRIICTLRDPVARTYSLYRILRKYSVIAESFEETLQKNPWLIELGRCSHHLVDWFDMFGPARLQVLIYDDLETDPQGFLQAICRFLSVPEIPLDQSTGLNRVNGAERAPRNPRIAKFARIMRERLRGHRQHRIVNFWKRTPLWEWCFSGGEEFGPIDPGIRDHLRTVFQPEVDALEVLLRRDLSKWRHQ
jgi:hypothetical protein